MCEECSCPQRVISEASWSYKVLSLRQASDHNVSCVVEAGGSSVACKREAAVYNMSSVCTVVLSILKK